MILISKLSRISLMVVGVCLIFACSRPVNNRANAAPEVGPRAAMPAPSPVQNPEDKMPRIKIEEAKQLLVDKKAIIIDVRGTDVYKMSHIKGALDFPLNKLESGDYKGLPKNKRIIAYCT